MKAFYSILKCATRPTVDEQVSIALFLMAGDKAYFRYSHKKLEVIKGLLPNEAYRLLKANLKNIDNYLSIKNSNHILANTEEHFLEENYFKYLSKYANNLITFSEPKRIELKINEEVYNSLYYKFIFEADELRGRETADLVVKIKKRINPQIDKKVNIDIELNASHISKLAVPTKTWFAGENKQPVTGEVTDFSNTSLHHLETHLRNYLYLTDKIKESSGKGHFFIVGDEPTKKLTENHKLWAAIKAQKSLSYLSSDEVDAIKEYMEKHGVTPLVKNLATQE